MGLHCKKTPWFREIGITIVAYFGEFIEGVLPNDGTIYKSSFQPSFAQCIAALVAAKFFNEREETSITSVYGVVTTGNIWKFLKLDDQVVYIDRPEYHVDRVGAILGILLHIVKHTAS